MICLMKGDNHIDDDDDDDDHDDVVNALIDRFD